MFKFNIEQEDDKVVVKLEGDLDIEATEVIENDLVKALQNSSNEVELDFCYIDFVDSSGIGILITLISHLKETNLKPTITNLKEDVQSVFDLLQLDEIIGKEVLVTK